jgi:hypothetical protein
LRPGKNARALLVLAAFLVLFVLVDRLSGPGRADRGTASGTTGPRATATTVARTGARATTTITTTTTTTRPSPTSGPTTTTPPTSSTLRPAKGVTVQVLNGVFVTGLANRVARQVRAAGYDVVATNTALGNYPVSRVYYTAGHKADAEAFRERFPAFLLVAPAPANLSRQVDLHAVIGRNYPGV